MAAEVSSMEGKREMVTRDLLGGYSSAASATAGRKDDHLDLSLKVTSGWQNHLDLLKRGPGPLNREPRELNLLRRESSTGLDLKPVGPTGFANGFHSTYSSVCTLEKVKFALERAGRESQGANDQKHHRRAASPSAAPATSSSSSSITSSSSMKRQAAEREEESADGGDSSAGGMMAAGCPRCLMYVLISKRSPRCPRCDSHVSVPTLAKKPRIDLNF